MEADLEASAWPFPGERFDAIVVTHYLHRPLFPHLLAALADDGVLLYETFAAATRPSADRRTPTFLLTPGELLDVAAGRLTVVAFEQGFVADAAPAVVQRIAAVGPADAGRQRSPASELDRIEAVLGCAMSSGRALMCSRPRSAYRPMSARPGPLNGVK